MYKFTRWVPQDRSGKVCWLLNELEVPYEVSDLQHKVHHDDPEYRERHPLGQVPAIEELSSGKTMFESGAICLYLADRHPDKGLIPTENRAAVYQWTFYNYATLEPVFESYWEIDAADPEIVSKKSEVDKKILKLLLPVEAALAKTEFIAGDEFTVADIPLGQSLFWLRNRPVFATLPRIAAYAEKLKARAAAQKAGLFAD